MQKLLIVSVCVVMLAGCATPDPIVLPPEIVEVPVFKPMPPECKVLPKVELPEGSTASDVMARQKKALDEAAAQIARCSTN